MQLSLPLNTPEDEETSQRVDLPQVDLMSFLPSEASFLGRAVAEGATKSREVENSGGRLIPAP